MANVTLKTTHTKTIAMSAKNLNMLAVLSRSEGLSIGQSLGAILDRILPPMLASKDKDSLVSRETVLEDWFKANEFISVKEAAKNWETTDQTSRRILEAMVITGDLYKYKDKGNKYIYKKCVTGTNISPAAEELLPIPEGMPSLEEMENAPTADAEYLREQESKGIHEVKLD